MEREWGGAGFVLVAAVVVVVVAGVRKVGLWVGGEVYDRVCDRVCTPKSNDDALRSRCVRQCDVAA
jgi:hypothetical protein